MKNYLQNYSMEDVDRICAAAYVMVCCVNDVANSAMVDAIAKIREAGLLSHGVKKNCRAAQEAYTRYEKRLKETLQAAQDRWSYWLDFADLYQERAARHVSNLRLAIKQVMDNSKVKQSELYSYVLTADTLLQYSIKNFDRYFKENAKRYGVDVSRIYRPARLDGVLRKWDEVRRLVVEDPEGEDVDFNSDERCRLAVKCLDTQLHSPDFINGVGEEVIKELHPEMLEELEQTKNNLQD